MHDKNYYITDSNLKGLAYEYEIITNNLSEIYSEVLDRLGLEGFISTKEAKIFQIILTFIKHADDYCFNRRTKHQNRYANSVGFVFPPGPPKYHATTDCRALRNDFSNYRVPEEIQERGREEVKKFQHFAIENRHLIREGKEDVFLLRLRGKFNLKGPMEHVAYINSGSSSFSEREALDLAALTFEIHKSVSRLEKIGESNSGKKALENYKFSPNPTKDLQNDNLNNDARMVLECKSELSGLVLTYIIKKYRPNGQTFSEALLQHFGFEACKMCCSDEAGVRPEAADPRQDLRTLLLRGRPLAGTPVAGIAVPAAPSLSGRTAPADGSDQRCSTNGRSGPRFPPGKPR